jgi:hypothetical protein
MPDVSRSDSQRSDSSRPRVSFNRDVRVKRIGKSRINYVNTHYHSEFSTGLDISCMCVHVRGKMRNTTSPNEIQLKKLKTLRSK